MKLRSLDVKKILPIWSSYKAWVKENPKFTANGYSLSPGDAVVIARNGKRYNSTVIGLTGSKGDQVLLAFVDPAFIRLSLYAVPEDDFGDRLGTKAVLIKKIFSYPAAKRLLLLQSLYTKIRTQKEWRSVTDGSLRTSDPDLFMEAHSFTSVNKSSIDSHIKKFLEDAYARASDLYYNEGKSFLSDSEFDRIKEILGPSAITQKVGAPVPKRESKTELAVQMGSLEKVKTQEEVERWLKKTGALKNGVVVMPKIDGISLQLVYNNAKFVQAFTRGDGFEGKDVTHNAKHIPSVLLTYGAYKNSYDMLPVAGRLVIRAEAFINLSTFNKKYALSKSNPTGFKNPRNMLAGVLNRQKPDLDILKDVQILAFDIQEGFEGTKSAKLTALSKSYFSTIPFSTILSKSTYSLDNTLDFATRQDYEVDGLVLEVNDYSLAKKLGTETNSINPAYARAYKPATNNKTAQTTVIDVEYNISKHGLIKPVLIVETVDLSGAAVNRVTAFNGAYIRDNKIGPGTVITLTRSGDVIPYIVSVDKSTKAKLPDPRKVGDWHWNDTGVDIIVDDSDNEEQQIQRLVHFFSAIKVENFSEGLIRRFYDHGYTTIKDILSLSVATMVKEIGGIQSTSAKKIKDEFDNRLRNISMPTLMYASGCFGRNFGSTKLTSLYNQMHDDLVFGWVGYSLSDIASTIAAIPGFSLESGKQFATSLKPFLRFLKDHNKLITPASYKPVKKTSSVLQGKNIVFTGFRDSQLQDWIEANGGKVGNSISKNTSLLLVKSLGSGSLKEQKAHELGVQVMTGSKFRTIYKIGA